MQINDIYNTNIHSKHTLSADSEPHKYSLST